MSDTEYIEILENYKEMIIHKWYNDITQKYPGFYHLEQVMQEAPSFFRFMLEIEIPVEHHTLYLKIPAICEYFFHRKIPIDHIILSNHLWVDAILFFAEQHRADKPIPLGLIRKSIQRVNEYERSLVFHYNNFTHELLEKQERTMTELHEARLTVVGKMAASMAHEIRNPLTSILGFLKLVRKDLSHNALGKVVSYLNLIETEFQNIQMQITGFLSFSKKDIVEEPFTKTSINSLIHSVISMITPRLIDYNIRFQFKDKEDIELSIQKTAIMQVISNILNNSIDALWEKEGNRKLIVMNRISEEQFIISVTNNGPQIPENIRNTLFEPFVTNKRHGTGLGLSICKQIMTKNNGDITYRSNSNETTFQIIFHIPSPD